jgi:hypothetical protein
VTFPTNNSNYAIVPFHGASPSGTFDCVSKDEIPADARRLTGQDASGKAFTYYVLSPQDTKAPDGVALAPQTRAWTSCQLRVASNYTTATNDQRFSTLLFPSGKDPASRSSSTALYIAIGIAAVAIVAGSSFLFLRRRRVAARVSQ